MDPRDAHGLFHGVPETQDRDPMTVALPSSAQACSWYTLDLRRVSDP